MEIPIRPIRRSVILTAEPLPEDAVVELPPAIVTVVGERCFGDVDGALTLHARRLAAATGVSLLSVHFDGPGADARLLGAALRPDISSPEIADAILALLG